jgi:hypothetical protein
LTVYEFPVQLLMFSFCDITISWEVRVHCLYKTYFLSSMVHKNQEGLTF